MCEPRRHHMRARNRRFARRNAFGAVLGRNGAGRRVTAVSGEFYRGSRGTCQALGRRRNSADIPPSAVLRGNSFRPIHPGAGTRPGFRCMAAPFRTRFTAERPNSPTSPPRVPADVRREARHAAVEENSRSTRCRSAPGCRRTRGVRTWVSVRGTSPLRAPSSSPSADPDVTRRPAGSPGGPSPHPRTCATSWSVRSATGSNLEQDLGIQFIRGTARHDGCPCGPGQVGLPPAHRHRVTPESVDRSALGRTHRRTARGGGRRG